MSQTFSLQKLHDHDHDHDKRVSNENPDLEALLQTGRDPNIVSLF